MLGLPSFSTDTRRFLADGINVAAGKNPYTTPAPIAIEYAHLRSFYPPLQEAVFGALAAVWPSPFFFRLFGGLFELVFVAWYLYRKRRRKIPALVLLFLFFNPLSLHEVWREGHLDHIAAIFLYLAILNIRARNSLRAYTFTAFSIGWKFLGIFAIAFLPRRGIVRKLFSPFAALSALFFAAQFLPALTATPFAEQGLTVYRQYWHHGNGIVDIFTAYGFAPGHGIYIVQWAILILAAVFLLLYLLRKIRLYDAIWVSVGFLLVLFPVQHAWYYFLLLPAIMTSRKWRVLLTLICFLTPLTYLGYLQSYKAAGFWVILSVWCCGCIIHFTRQKTYRLR
jgi:hypothetical protein